ncbi:hypothetical protein Tco_0585634, partial [Tanacetum coccineum]
MSSESATRNHDCLLPCRRKYHWEPPPSCQTVTSMSTEKTTFFEFPVGYDLLRAYGVIRPLGGFDNVVPGVMTPE